MSWANGDPVRQIFEDLTLDGFPIVTIDDQIQWGNDTHQTRLGAMYTTAQSSFGFNASKVNLLAASGGTPAVLNWAKNNLSKVQSIAVILPAVDIRAIDSNNRTDLLSLAHATYGPSAATGYGALPPTDHNPASNAASYAGIPIKLWYSGNDQICLPAEVTAFASGVGSSATAVSMGNSVGAVGHGAENLASADVRAFFAANG